MRKLGEVRNTTHDGLFVIVCDSNARFGGWDEHGERLADEGSTQLDLDGVAAFVEEAHGDGRHEVWQSDDGTIWMQPPLEDGVQRIRPDELESAKRDKVIDMGSVDVPSGTLTIALAYPPLNTTSDGDHAGVTHADGERLDVPVTTKRFAIRREFVKPGQVVALRPA